MTRPICLIESLEGRRFFSAGATASAVRVIGPTAGVHAAAPPKVLSITSPQKLGSARRDLTITVALDSAGGALNTTTLYPRAVKLWEVDVEGNHLAEVSTGNPQSSGGGDTISLTPNRPLKARTRYQFELNAAGTPSQYIVKNTLGAAYTPYAFAFTTNTEVAIADPRINFSQEDAKANISRPFTAVTIGPDGKLYAATLAGEIFRWTITGNGTLSGRQQINTVRDYNTASDNPSGARIITGITFAPDATAGNLRLFVSHGQYKLGTTASTGNGVQYQADNYTGSISLLTGANLDTYRELIVHIPRSVKDHLNNQVVFDPSGQNFHFVIPSMTAMGAPDAVWGNRPENVLSAAMFRVNIGKLNNELTTNGGPIDLDPSAEYDVYDSDNALNIYADGIRNAYDMVFHSNGHLYTATNGSSAGGNAPGTPGNLANVPSTRRLDYASDGNYSGGSVPAANNILQTEQDLLLDVQRNAYYGHPNPERGEYVLNGGNVNGNVNDPIQYTKAYPLGTQPDRNFVRPAYDLGKNVSPDGMIEYKSNSFGGLLKGYLLIARYNGGQDILAVKPGSNGTISGSNIETRITGLFGLQKPLDLVEDRNTGNLYTVQLDQINQAGSIVLMKPKAIDVQGAAVTSNSVPYRASFYVAPGNRKGAVVPARLVNNGTTTMVLDVSASKITRNRGNFVVLNLPEDDIYILPGESYTFNVRGILSRGQAGPVYGNVAFATNDPVNRYTVLQLRAFNVFAASKSGAKPASLAAARPAAVSAPIARTSGDAAADEADSNWWLKDVVA